MAVIVQVSLLLFAVLGNVCSYNILVLTPFGTRSVRSVFSYYCNGLLQKGHKVTLLSSGEPYPIHPNFTHVQAPHSAFDEINLFEIRENGNLFKLWMKAFPLVAKKMYKNPKIIELMEARHDFDAIVINSAANEMAFPFLYDFEAPFITLAPAGTETLQLSYLGNIISPAALPTIMAPYDNYMTFSERVYNAFSILLMRYGFRRAVLNPLMEVLKEVNPNIPDPQTMYPKQSLSLLNHHHLLDGSIPLLPNQVEVGCINCKISTDLPEDLLHWLNEAEDQKVVYFSLGSLQKSIPKKYIEIFLEAFAKMPHKVLAKLPEFEIWNVSSNVKTMSWVPQQGVLGHTSVVAFISHCGKLSSSEALYHGVPILGVPITFDQPRTCARLSRRGEAVVLQWETITPELIVESIWKLTNDTRYKARCEGVSRRMKDQRDTGLQKSVWWTEYIIKHGSTFLDYSAAQLSLAQYLMLDVVFAIFAIFSTTVCTLYFGIRMITWKCFNRSTPRVSNDASKKNN